MNIKEEFSRFKNWLIDHRDSYESILSEKPYCLEIKHDNVFGRDFVLFKYNQIESDFNEPFVKLCRGLVLDAHYFDPVVFPFVKFHNAGEKFADKIDWESAHVDEKVDGSIMKVVKIGNDLLIGTNGNIDASKANITEQIGCEAKTFLDLFKMALYENKILWEDFVDMIDEGKTYIFELIGPYNKIVVRYDAMDIVLLGIRDNETLEEEYFRKNRLAEVFRTPKSFPLQDIDDCFKAVNELGDNAEGFVVVDKDFNRIKIKSDRYLELHRLHGNGIMSTARAIEIVRANEIDEVIAYFPQFEDGLNKVKTDMNIFCNKLSMHIERLSNVKDMFKTRKDAAVWIKKEFGSLSGLGFAYLDGKIMRAQDWIMNIPVASLMKWLGYCE